MENPKLRHLKMEHMDNFGVDKSILAIANGP